MYNNAEIEDDGSACSEAIMTNLIGSGLNLLCLQSHSKPECRWTWPQVAILDANQKVRGMLETRMPITDHGQGTYINPKLNSNKPILCSKS